MESTLKYLKDKFDLDYTQPMPIQIPRVDRETLTEWLHELDFKAGVEVGIASGEYSELIAKNNPQMKVYGVDPHATYSDYTDYIAQPVLNGLKAQAHERLKPYPNYQFIPKYSLDGVKDFEDNSLDFVYIDGNHNFPSVANDIWEWSKKLRPGGIISGHDYYNHKGPTDIHVWQAVNGYTNALHITPWFVLGSNNSFDLPRDKSRSWMWIC